MSDFYESQISDLEDHVKELEADKELLRDSLIFAEAQFKIIELHASRSGVKYDANVAWRKVQKALESTK